ncbi:hypothetical protein V8C26DRAFT_392375 [Trichoderma gracile]
MSWGLLLACRFIFNVAAVCLSQFVSFFCVCFSGSLPRVWLFPRAFCLWLKNGWGFLCSFFFRGRRNASFVAAVLSTPT